MQRQLQEVGVTIPVIIMMAAPEVEGWLLADWDNSFGQEYCNILSAEQNKYFSTKFRMHVNEKILTDTYKNDIELYGYFKNTYFKLSEQIQKALEENDFMEGYSDNQIDGIIRYSKTRNGGNMLAKIEPDELLEKCPHCFREGYYSLQNI